MRDNRAAFPDLEVSEMLCRVQSTQASISGCSPCGGSSLSSDFDARSESWFGIILLQVRVEPEDQCEVIIAAQKRCHF
jgi:hypothetical protein